MKNIILCLMFLSLPQLVHAGWRDFFNDIKESVRNESSAGSVAAAISEERVVEALKQALKQGVEESVKQLGKENGFLNDASVKITMPRSLRKLEKGLRKIGQHRVADRFIQTMNHAAEQSVSRTTAILVEAVKNMSLQDAVGILNGEEDAATRYFERTSSAQLNGSIKPIVQKATSAVGVTDAYKKMISKAGFLAKYVDSDSMDIDQYVTNKAIAGLFTKIALEEKRIREQPVARTTDLLREVFGGL